MELLDSRESRSSNTSLVFCFHNGIIHTLNKVHTKKLGSPANTQLNLRLILENVNPSFLSEFREKIELQIKAYEKEINQILTEQIQAALPDLPCICDPHGDPVCYAMGGEQE